MTRRSRHASLSALSPRFRAEHLQHVQAETLVAPLGDGSGTANGLLISVVYSPFVAG